VGTQRRWLVCALLASALVAPACGNRLSHEEVLAQNGVGAAGQRAAGGAVGAGDGSAGGDTVSGAAQGSADATGANGGTGGGSGAGAVAGTSGGGAGGTGTGAETASGAGAGTKAPLKIAMVGWLSGIGGQTTTPARDVLVAWSKWVNAKGGINGHPVQLYVADDGGNEARSVSIVRDLYENKHIIALVYYGSGSAVAVANYAKSVSLPIIGGVTVEAVWNQNPMMFPASASTDGHFWGAAKLALDAGAKKVATVYCTEVSSCQQSNDTFVKYAKELGLEVVYQGRISFTQPDYTAECLQMHNAGAQAVVPVTENSSIVRLAQSCDRQGYKPTWDLSTTNDGMVKLPQFDNAIGAVISFPWFLHGDSPAIAEYTQALQKYAPGRVDDGVDFQSGAWVAGKLFERAAAKVSDNPTKDEILEGLWAMRGESLGGLLPGGLARTFTRNQPTPETFCVFDPRIQGGKWVAPRGTTPICR